MGNERAPHHALLVQFLAALLQRTLGCSTQETHQQALQGFLDDLTPWISPADLPRRLGQPFTLFDHLALTPFASRQAICPIIMALGRESALHVIPIVLK